MARPAPRLYAHRGAAAEIPENTLPSFERALELGADALEMDLHMTRDGHIVVSHDDSGTRMCGVSATFASSTLDEVRTWDAGYGFVDPSGARPFAGRGFRVPTLEEVLGELPDVILNVDMKQRRPSIAKPLLKLLRRHRAEERVIIASFHTANLLRVRVAGYAGLTSMAEPEIVAMLLLPRFLFRRLPLTGQCAQLPVRARGIELGARAVIERCHSVGVRVDYWTVNDCAEAQRLLELGADGIMTDDPRAIAPAFAAFRR